MAHDPLLRPGEVARRTSVTTETVKRWLDRGVVNFVRLPSGQRRIPESELDRILERQTANYGRATDDR